MYRYTCQIIELLISTAIAAWIYAQFCCLTKEPLTKPKTRAQIREEMLQNSYQKGLSQQQRKELQMKNVLKNKAKIIKRKQLIKEKARRQR